MTILYIILAGLLALAIAFFQYIYKSKKSTTTNTILSILRFITLFSGLLLLINPKFKATTYVSKKPKLVVAVDNSQSLKHLKLDTIANQLLNQIQNNNEMQSHFDVEYYTFGKDFNYGDSLDYSENQSNVSQVFDKLSQVYKNTTAPVILVTDGNQTYGNDYQFATNTYKSPVYPIVLGDTTQFVDLKIQQLNVNKYAFLKNKFPVEVIAIYNGSEPVTTKFKIFSKGKIVYKQELNFSSEKTSEVISINLPTERVGVGYYKAELSPLSVEKNRANNFKRFAIEVVDQKTTVAIISDIIHPDLGAFKKAIESNEQRRAVIVTPNEFISRKDEFQLALLYQPTNSFKSVFEALQTLRINTFVIAGLQTNWNGLNTQQSYFKHDISGQKEDYQATLNQNYTTFIVDDISFESFPPLQSEFGNLNLAAANQIMLYKTVNGIPTESPLLATFEANTYRGAVLLGEGIWRWRAQSYLNEKSFETFDTFIGKIIQYLSSNKKRNRLMLSYESIYNGNDDVKISAQYFNKNYEFDASASLNITLKNKNDGTLKTYPFILKNNNYQVDLSGITAGEYSFTVKASKDNLSRSGILNILDYNVEQQFLSANLPKLKALANSSKGKTFFADNAKTLYKELLADKRYVAIESSKTKVVPLINWYYLLAIIIVSLTSEWFIRKYNGLI